MGISSVFGNAFAKAQISAGAKFACGGKVFISVRDKDKRNIVSIAKRFAALGYELISTRQTALVLRNHGVATVEVKKVHEGSPNIVEIMKKGEIDFLVNTPLGKNTLLDDTIIRGTALLYKIFCITTLSGANALLTALESVRKKSFDVKALQEY